MTGYLFLDRRIFFFWEPVYNWQGIRKDNDLFLTTEVIIIHSWAKLLGQNKLVSDTLICYIGHAKRRLHCPWDTLGLLKSISPNLAVLLIGKSVLSPAKSWSFSTTIKSLCLTASVILVSDIWFSKVIFPKLKENQTAKVRAPVGWRSVHTSGVSSFTIRTNLQVIKESESEYIKNVGMEM